MNKLISIAALATRSFVGLVTFSAVVFAQNDFASSVRAELERAYRNPSTLSLVMHQLNIPQELEPFVREHFEAIGQEDSYLDYISREVALNEAYITRSDGSLDTDRIHELTAAVSQDQIAKGVARLSPTDQRAFYSLLVQMMRRMPTSTCGRVARAELNAVESQSAELSAMIGLPPARLRLYFSVTRRSLLAEINGVPTPIPLTPSEAAMAESAQSEALSLALERHPRAEFLFEALMQPTIAAPEDVCEVVIMVMDTALSVEGTVGDWVMRLMTQSGP